VRQVGYLPEKRIDHNNKIKEHLHHLLQLDNLYLKLSRLRFNVRVYVDSLEEKGASLFRLNDFVVHQN